MSIFRHVLMAAAALAVEAALCGASATSVSQFLFADQGKDQVVLAGDRNGDGDTNDAGETAVFFDASNASGLGSAAGNVFALSQASDQSVLVGDGDTDTVYRLRDGNYDGDANDADEAQVWFSGSSNASGFKLNTPNGIAEGPDGAIYVVEADTSGSPTGDWVYRTLDLNGDGDANDAGEATKWLNLKAINASSSPFEIRFDGDTAYVMDTAGGTPDVIYRATDANHDNVVDASEVTVFASEANSFGAKFDFAMDVGKDALWTWQWLAESGLSSVFSLTDLDSSGAIDAPGEVVEAWNTSLLDDAHGFLAGFALAMNEITGEILITSNDGAASGDWIIRLLDLDGDGTFFDAGEWSFVLDRTAQGTYPDRPRDVTYYTSPVPVPATLPLLASGIGALGTLAARRRRRLRQ
jgi:hypothetical protein